MRISDWSSDVCSSDLRNPYPPFTTSTLQQEASRKLGFGTTRTMRVAQRLYEGIDIGGETVGLITYMRTDGVTLAQEALDGARALIAGDYGDAYLPDAPRQYKSKQKRSEAHTSELKSLMRNAYAIFC